MDSIIFLTFAVAYFILIFYLMKGHMKVKLSAIIVLVLIALVYDNFIIGIGRLIGKGDLLESLNVLRFWLHALCTPTLILFSLAVLQESGVAWSKSISAKIIASIWFVAAIVVEYFTELKDLVIEPAEQYGALSYSSTTIASGPPMMILLVLASLLIAAVTLFKRFKWWWMLVGVIIMTIGSAVPIPIPSEAATNLFELILLFTLVLTKKKIDSGALNGQYLN